MKSILFYTTVISLVFFYISHIFAKKFKFFDHPSKRKIHLKPIPYTGGLGLILSFFMIIWISFFDYILLNIIFTSFFIFILGFLDDKYKINIGSRILFQILIIYFFIENYNLKIDYIFELGAGYKLDLGGMNLIFTVLCVIFFINAYNYTDGIDGLLTIQTIFIFTSLILLQIIFYKFVNYDLIFLIIPLLIFLLYNFNLLIFPKLFLGNGGSTMLGFIVSFFVIYYGYYSNLTIDPEIIIWVLAFIVYEFLSTNLSRILNNKDIFKPGQDHIHYFILKKYNSIYIANLIILFMNILFLLIGYFSFLLGDIISLINFIIIFIIYFIFRQRLANSIKKNY
jgi:UDP-GlcNAc:undecaprenyl-phosphate/decaprenyl-phosphate GlcNAc-1-phosphate transferase